MSCLINNTIFAITMATFSLKGSSQRMNTNLTSQSSIQWIDKLNVVATTEGSTRPHEAYEISKSRDFEPDFLISNLISIDF